MGNSLCTQGCCTGHWAVISPLPGAFSRGLIIPVFHFSLCDVSPSICHAERTAWQQPVNTVEIPNAMGAFSFSGALVLLLPSEDVQLQNLEHPRRKKGKLEPISVVRDEEAGGILEGVLTRHNSQELCGRQRRQLSALVGSLVSCQQFSAGGSF